MWAGATATLATVLPVAQLFPLIDLWRLALLDEPVSSWCATATPVVNAVHIFLDKAVEALNGSPDARNTILVVLRMLSNAFANATLTKSLLSATGKRARNDECARVEPAAW